MAKATKTNNCDPDHLDEKFPFFVPNLPAKPFDPADIDENDFTRMMELEDFARFRLGETQENEAMSDKQKAQD